MSAIGRPTKYKPEFCQVVIDVGKRGGNIYSMAAACGVVTSTLYEWYYAHPEFSSALTRAQELSKSYVHENIIENLGNPNFNANAAKLLCQYTLPQRRSERIRAQAIVEAGTFHEQTKELIKLVASGDVDTENAKRLADIISIGAKVEEVDKLRDNLEKIEESMKQ